MCRACARGWKRDFAATIYEDAYSPFCLIAERIQDADVIHDYLTAYCREVPKLNVMRNDVYSRFCHEAYDKGNGAGGNRGAIARHRGGDLRRRRSSE
jgi:hypothetical protein